MMVYPEGRGHERENQHCEGKYNSLCTKSLAKVHDSVLGRLTTPLLSYESKNIPFSSAHAKKTFQPVN